MSAPSTVAPAPAPRSARDLRVLFVDGLRRSYSLNHASRFAHHFLPGDLLVVNDAATLPASLPAVTQAGTEFEFRFGRRESEHVWRGVAFGRGTFQDRTEDRGPPPPIAEGETISLGAAGGGLEARVVAVRNGLVDLELRVGEKALWRGIYRWGRPIQYAHVAKPLALWDVQNVYARRPWAFEMPSAGRILTLETIQTLRQLGVEFTSITHEAGLSAMGSADLDAKLPWPERYEIGCVARAAIARASRVIAVGTSVVRAIESWARTGQDAGVTELHIDERTALRRVNALVTGVHEAETSHHALLSAFVAPELLQRAVASASDAGLLGHEFGDLVLATADGRNARLRE